MLPIIGLLLSSPDHISSRNDLGGWLHMAFLQGRMSFMSQRSQTKYNTLQHHKALWNKTLRHLRHKYYNNHFFAENFHSLSFRTQLETAVNMALSFTTELGNYLSYVHSILFVIARARKQPKCPSTEEWMRKMWYIYTMKYYTAVKNNGSLKFAGKCMDLESIILSEVT